MGGKRWWITGWASVFSATSNFSLAVEKGLIVGAIIRPSRDEWRRKPRLGLRG